MKSRFDWIYKRQVMFDRFDRSMSELSLQLSKDMGSLRDAMLYEFERGQTITFSVLNDSKDFTPK